MITLADLELMLQAGRRYREILMEERELERCLAANDRLRCEHLERDLAASLALNREQTGVIKELLARKNNQRRKGK